MSDDLIRRAEIKAGMMTMGEPIAFGSDAAIIGELIARIRELEAALDSKHAVVGRNIWRFWSNKALELSKKVTRLEAENKALREALEAVCEADSVELAMHGIAPACQRILTLIEGDQTDGRY